MADGFTKMLPRQKHAEFMRQLGLVDIKAAFKVYENWGISFVFLTICLLLYLHLEPHYFLFGIFVSIWGGVLNGTYRADA